MYQKFYKLKTQYLVVKPQDIVLNHIYSVSSKFVQGFTLAEVLITLTIVAIISVFVISPVIKVIQDMEFKKAYRKAFADASTAWLSAYRNETLEPGTFYGDTSNHNNFLAFMNKMSIMYKCPFSDNTACWASNENATVADGQPFVSSQCFIDNSGRAWCSMNLDSYFIVDSNGLAPPNHYGKDRFPLMLSYDNTNWSVGSGTYAVRYVVKPIGDYGAYQAAWCPSPPCYYKIRLKE